MSPVRDENLQIAARIARMLRDVPSGHGLVELQNNYVASWNGPDLVIAREDQVVIRAPIGELANLETERWG